MNILQELEPAPKLHGFDPIHEVGRLGRIHFGSVGDPGLRALEMSFVNASFRQACFDGSEARARTHVLFDWYRGGFKNTIQRTFRTQCATMVDGATLEETTDDASFLNVVSATTAIFQGSMNDGAPTLPLLMGARFVITGELLTLLGADKDSMDTVTNFLNVGLEEGRMDVYRVKFGGKGDLRDWYRQFGITYNRLRGSLTYDVDLSFWAGSRPMSRADEARLNISGFRDRFWVVRSHQTPEEVGEEVPFIPDPQDYSRVKAWNDALWATEWNAVPEPPRRLVEKSVAKFKQICREYEKRGLSPIAGHRSNRNITDIYQLYAAIAAIQTVNNDGKGPYDQIRYDLGVEEHVDARLHEYAKNRLPNEW